MHAYSRILPDRVWDVVEKHIRALLRLFEPLVPPEGADGVGDEGVAE